MILIQKRPVVHKQIVHTTCLKNSALNRTDETSRFMVRGESKSKEGKIYYLHGIITQRLSPCYPGQVCDVMYVSMSP